MKAPAFDKKKISQILSNLCFYFYSVGSESDNFTGEQCEIKAKFSFISEVWFTIVWAFHELFVGYYYDDTSLICFCLKNKINFLQKCSFYKQKL